MYVDYSDNTVGVNLTGGGLGDILRGGAGFGTDDSLNGGGGNDVLEGGFGANTIEGGTGINTASYEHFIPLGSDNGSPPDPTVAGVTVNLTTRTATDVGFFGFSVLNDTLSNIQNVLGSAFADTITGDANQNTLNGGAGNDVLDGGTGNDTLIGGAGLDTYLVRDSGDVVTETSGQGTDTVKATVDYTIGDNVERLVLAGRGNIDGTGNDASNIIKGNVGDNQIDGGIGRDVLIGLGGADTFVFSDALGVNNVDRITDFAPGTDKIGLHLSVFADLDFGDGTLSDAQFASVTLGEQYSDDVRIVYREDKGALYYDADGGGGRGAVLFAAVDGAPTLGADDFTLFPSR